MGLMQQAVATYNANLQIVGVYMEGHDPLAPVGHTLTGSNIEITINRTGNFLSARRVEKSEPKILIPVTEASGGRSGTKAYTNPHPLCDALKYYIAEENFFLEQLKKWENSKYSHPFLTPIRLYLEKKTIQKDLTDHLGEAEEGNMIRWRVEGIPGEDAACWRNRNLQKAFTDFYLNTISDRPVSFCMVNGEVAPAANQHPKGIVAINGNAKLISANDTTGFTYRGRISEDWQASSVSYEASQKAHNALRWLVSEQGVREFIGNRVYICWNPNGKKLPQPMRGLRKTESPPTYVPSDYKDSLNGIIMGFGDGDTHIADAAVLAAFDAATPGRLAVVYYNEIAISSFLQRMKDWDSECCWYFGKHGIQAPSLLRIVDCAFGIQGTVYLETDDKIKRQHVQRLLNCKVSGGIFPADIVQLLCKRASSPQSFSDSNWRTILHTACAAIQKYNYDTNQGGNEMAWELNKKDRSFQYGRLLAAMERAEQDYYSKTQEDRQTNAIKFMSEFRQRPWIVYERINRMLNQAYLTRIAPWQTKRYQRLSGEICSMLGEFPESELNRPLENSYLMGYELQRNAFFEKHDEQETEE